MPKQLSTYTAEDIAVWTDGVRTKLLAMDGEYNTFVTASCFASSVRDTAPNWLITFHRCRGRDAKFEDADISVAITQAEAWLDEHEHADERLAAVLGIPLTQAAE